MNRRAFLAAASAIALAIALPSPAISWTHGTPAKSNGGMLMGLAALSNFSGNNPFLNWWKTGSSINVSSTLNGVVTGQAAWNAAGTASPGGGTAYFNPATGELNNPCPSDVTFISRGFFTPASTAFIAGQPSTTLGPGGTPWWYGQVFKITWTGTSVPVIPGTANLGSGGTFVVDGAHAATLTLGTGTSIANVAINFPVGNVNNPPQNIFVYQSQYAASVTANQVFNPDWLADVRQFGILRFMDWVSVNTSGVSDISQLADNTYNTLCQSLGGLGIFTGSISGTVLTAVGVIGQLAIGSVITGPGVAANTVIASPGTGTGLDGTYNLSVSQTVASVAMVGLLSVGSNGNCGPKSGIHPSLVCQLANLTGCDVYYTVPVAITNAAMDAIAASFQANLNSNLKVYFEYGNENWNFGLGETFYYCNAQVYPGTGTTGAPTSFAGYRAAQLWQRVNNIFGAGSRSRWRGCLGSQMANTAVTTAGIAGANYWINNGAAGPALTDLFNEVDVAPYFGNFEGGVGITNITVGATPTVTTTASAASPLPAYYANGAVVRMFLSAGSMAGVLNNVDVTISNVQKGTTPNTFQINVATTGTAYAAGTNYAANGLLFQMMDTSLSNHNSTPVTYPTQYTYFAQQMAKSILTGASDNGYATGASANLTSSGIPLQMAQHQLIAGVSGLDLRQYEGGNTFLGDANLSTNAQFLAYSINWIYDTANGSPNSIAGCYQASFAAWSAAFSGYPAKYVEAGFVGPFNGLRFYPGDEGNPTWAALVAQNALGPFVDPTPPATGVYSYKGSNYFVGAGTNHSFSIDIGPAAADRLVIVGAAGQNVPTITSVVVNGVTLTQDVLFAPGGFCGLYSGIVAAGSGLQNVTITYVGGAFLSRSAFVFTARGLLSNLVRATNSGPSGNVTIAETKGALVISIGDPTSSGSVAYSGGLVSGGLSPIQQDVTTARGCMGYWNPAFSSGIFASNVGAGAGADQVLAAYR